MLSDLDPTVITDVGSRFVDDGDLITGRCERWHRHGTAPRARLTDDKRAWVERRAACRRWRLTRA